MEPTEAVNALEVAFRQLIRQVWGPSWEAKSKVDMDKLKAKLETEKRARRGAIVSSDLLDYLEFSQLGNILMGNWGDFSDAFGKRKYVEVYVDRLVNLRNAPMHGRQLLPFERELLSGMVGELLNMLAIYRSKSGPDTQHYPVVNSVVDSFGNKRESSEQVETGIRLAVGDRVTFNCEGTDPQGRNLTWHASTTGGAQSREVARASGSQVELMWVVSDADVTEKLQVIVAMESVSKYHRLGTIDEAIFFIYAVEPPSAIAPPASNSSYS